MPSLSSRRTALVFISRASGVKHFHDRTPHPLIAARIRRFVSRPLVAVYSGRLGEKSMVRPSVLFLLFSSAILFAQSPLYLDPHQPIEVRVRDLLGRMTLEEKIGQINMPCVYVDELGKEDRKSTRLNSSHV